MTSARRPPTPEDVVAAAARLEGHVHRTALFTSRTLDALAGARLVFKPECLQRGGAFKARGAFNALLSLTPEERARGVVTHSSGNHGQAVALAARACGVRATVIVPTDASPVKVAAIAAYGATIVSCAPGTAAREAKTAEVLAASGAALVHPYDDARVMAGQGTAARELLADAPDVTVLVTPVGGGGLLSGTALAAQLAPRPPAVLGAEPAGADDAARSLASGHMERNAHVDTIADGLRSVSLGELPFALIRRHVERIVVVTDAQIEAAMQLLLERLKLVVEPSGAVGLAAVLAAPARFRGETVGLVLSGGNVALKR